MPGFENFRGRVALAVGAGLLISTADFAAMTASAPAEAFQAAYFLKTKGDEAAQKAVAAELRRDFDVRYRFGIRSAAEQRDGARAVYWGTQIFFGLLLALVVVIAVFALIASMAATVLERRREIGILKALGLRRNQLFRFFLGEAITLTLAAGLTGSAIGFALAWFFVIQAGLLAELPVRFTMPYLTLIATILISLAAGCLAALLPTRRLIRLTAAEILRGS